MKPRTMQRRERGVARKARRQQNVLQKRYGGQKPWRQRFGKGQNPKYK